MRKNLDNGAMLMHELNQIVIQESERQNILHSKHSASQIISTSLEINSVKEAVKNDMTKHNLCMNCMTYRFTHILYIILSFLFREISINYYIAVCNMHIQELG